jgi:hypothetical protein
MLKVSLIFLTVGALASLAVARAQEPTGVPPGVNCCGVPNPTPMLTPGNAISGVNTATISGTNVGASVSTSVGNTGRNPNYSGPPVGFRGPSVPAPCYPGVFDIFGEYHAC